MNSSAKNLLLFAALMIAVVLGAMLYLRSNQIGDPSPIDPGAAPPISVEAPPLPEEIHPDLEAGLAALKESRLEEARARLGLVPEDDPGFAIAVQSLGLTQLGLGELQASLASYRRVAELQPENPGVYVDLAWAQFRIGRPHDAEISLLRALELEPSLLSARYNLGLFRIAVGDLPRAIPTYDRAIRADPESDYFSRALDDLLRLHEERAELPAVHYAVAFFAKTIGRRDLEIEELEHFLDLESEGPAAEVARARLGDAREATGAP